MIADRNRTFDFLNFDAEYNEKYQTKNMIAMSAYVMMTRAAILRTVKVPDRMRIPRGY